MRSGMGTIKAGHDRQMEIQVNMGCKKKYSKLFLALGFVVLSRVASAGIIYSNIGTGFPNDYSRVYFASSTFEGATFTTSGGGDLSSVEFAAFSYTPGTTLTAGLYMDSSGQPGTLLESWNTTVPLSQTSGNIPPIVLTSVVTPSLLPGTAYWFVLAQPDGYYSDVYGSDQNVDGGIWAGSTTTAMSHVFSDFEAMGLQLNGISETPEPSSAMMLLLVCVGLGLLKARRRPGLKS